MTSTTTTGVAATGVCASCTAELALEGVRQGDFVLCACCGAIVDVPPAPDTRRISRKAVLSVVLAVLSVFFSCVTGLPALVLGIWALRDIHRREDELKGKAAAITGIALGAVFSFLCGPMTIAILVPAVQQVREAARRVAAANRAATVETSDATTVTTFADQIGTLEVPGDLFPYHAHIGPEPGTIEASFGSFSPSAMVRVALLQVGPNPRQRNIVEARLADLPGDLAMNVQSTRPLTIIVNGQPLEVIEKFGINRRTNLPARHYTAILPHGDRLIGISVCTLDELAPGERPHGPGDPATNLTEEEVKALFESFKPAALR